MAAGKLVGARSAGSAGQIQSNRIWHPAFCLARHVLSGLEFGRASGKSWALGSSWGLHAPHTKFDHSTRSSRPELLAHQQARRRRACRHLSGWRGWHGGPNEQRRHHEYGDRLGWLWRIVGRFRWHWGLRWHWGFYGVLGRLRWRGGGGLCGNLGGLRWRDGFRRCDQLGGKRRKRRNRRGPARVQRRSRRGVRAH